MRRQWALIRLVQGKSPMQCQVAPRPRLPMGWLAGVAVYCLAVAALAQMPQDRSATLPSLPLNTPGPARNSPLDVPAAPPAGSGQLVVDVIIDGEHTSKD